MNFLQALALLWFTFWAAASSGDAIAAAKNETLWHEWYLITHNGAAVGFFEETAERRGAEKQIALTQKWVEKAGGKIETYIGSVAEDPGLKPVAFFVDRKMPSADKSYKTDARVKDKKLEITFKPASAALTKSTEYTPLQPSMLLSGFLSLAIARHFQEKGDLSFVAVVEDVGDMNVEVKKGKAELLKDEKKIGGDTCRRASVQYGGKPQEWWVAKNGKTCLVITPESGMKLELSTEKLAKKALGE